MHHDTLPPTPSFSGDLVDISFEAREDVIAMCEAAERPLFPKLPLSLPIYVVDVLAADNQTFGKMRRTAILVTGATAEMQTVTLRLCDVDPVLFCDAPAHVAKLDPEGTTEYCMRVCSKLNDEVSRRILQKALADERYHYWKKKRRPAWRTAATDHKRRYEDDDDDEGAAPPPVVIEEEEEEEEFNTLEEAMLDRYKSEGADILRVDVVPAAPYTPLTILGGCLLKITYSQAPTRWSLTRCIEDDGRDVLFFDSDSDGPRPKNLAAAVRIHQVYRNLLDQFTSTTSIVPGTWLVATLSSALWCTTQTEVSRVQMANNWSQMMERCRVIFGSSTKVPRAIALAAFGQVDDSALPAFKVKNFISNTSRAGAEAALSVSAVALLPGNSSAYPPLRITSVEMRCCTPNGVASADPAAGHCICTFALHTESEGRTHEVILQLGDAGSEVGASEAPRLFFPSERELIYSFRDLILSLDPDLILWYNSTYCLGYLAVRAEALGVEKTAVDFTRWPGASSKGVRVISQYRNEPFQCYGRLMFDLRRHLITACQVPEVPATIAGLMALVGAKPPAPILGELPVALEAIDDADSQARMDVMATTMDSARQMAAVFLHSSPIAPLLKHRCGNAIIDRFLQAPAAMAKTKKLSTAKLKAAAGTLPLTTFFKKTSK